MPWSDVISNIAQSSVNNTAKRCHLQYCKVPLEGYCAGLKELHFGKVHAGWAKDKSKWVTSCGCWPWPCLPHGCSWSGSVPAVWQNRGHPPGASHLHHWPCKQEYNAEHRPSTRCLTPASLTLQTAIIHCNKITMYNTGRTINTWIKQNYNAENRPYIRTTDLLCRAQAIYRVPHTCTLDPANSQVLHTWIQ